LAGEHSVVHRTRALATVIDKRTYCQFDFVPAQPAAAASSSDAAAAASASAAPEASEPRVTLNIVTSQLRQTSDWSFAELAEKARTLSIPTTFDALRGATLDHIKQSLRSLNHTDEVPPQVFLLFYFVLLRGGQPSAPHTRGSLTVTIESQLPMSAGLGSSAAYTSSLSAGFVWLALQLQEQLNAENAASSSGAAPVDLRAEKGNLFGESCSCPWSEEPYVIPRPGSARPLPNTPTFQPCVHLKKAINAFAFEGEKIIHGNPSGVDNTCAVFGQFVQNNTLPRLCLCASCSRFFRSRFAFGLMNIQ
jgi:mevalonate kinase